MQKNILFVVNNEIEFNKRKILIKKIKARKYCAIGVATGLKHNHDVLDKTVDSINVDRKNPFKNFFYNLRSLKKIIRLHKPHAIFLSHFQITLLFLFLSKKILPQKTFLILSGLGKVFHENGAIGKIIFYSVIAFAKAKGISILVQGAQNTRIIKKSFNCLEFPPSTCFEVISSDKKSEKAVLAIGRICKGKGINDYIYCAKKLGEEFDFKWIGSDETNGWLKRQAIPINAKFDTQTLSKKEILNEMKFSKFFLHPSLHEGIPNVCIEANSTNCLIIHNSKSGLCENNLALEELEYCNQEKLLNIFYQLKDEYKYRSLLEKQIKMFRKYYSSVFVQEKYDQMLKKLNL